MVLRRSWPAAVSPGIVSRLDIKMAIKNRRPKNQWLMSRRFVSFADGSKKLTKIVNKLDLPAKEQIRLPINHWLIGRRNCKVHLKKRCFSSIASCLTTGMRFETNGFKASRLVSQLAYETPSVKEPMVDVVFCSLTSQSLLKTNGFNAFRGV